MPEPALTDDITAGELDADVRRDLRGLQRDTADTVARHLVAAGRLVDEDPELALEHARFARARASRIAVVREAAGIAAYHAGEWAEALGELRAARRMGGGPGHLAVMADIERALGRPERALELGRGPEARELGQAESIELAIVAAGARRDLGELDAAVVSLQIPELDPARRDPWSARLFYAYADNLLAAGRESDALQWFVHAADADDDGETDAARRIAELTGEPLADDDFDLGVEDEPPAGTEGVDAGSATGDGGSAVEGDRPGPDVTTSGQADTDLELDDPASEAPATHAHTEAPAPDRVGAEAAGVSDADGSDPEPEPSGGTGPVVGAGSEDAATEASDTEASDTEASDTEASDTEASDTEASGSRVEDGAEEERDRGVYG